MVFGCAMTLLCSRIYFGKPPISASYGSELILFQTGSRGHSPRNLLNRKMHCFRAFSKRGDSCHFFPESLGSRFAHIFCCYRNRLFGDWKTWVSRRFIFVEYSFALKFHFWHFLRLFNLFYSFFQQNRTSLSSQVSLQPYPEQLQFHQGLLAGPILQIFGVILIVYLFAIFLELSIIFWHCRPTVAESFCRFLQLGTRWSMIRFLHHYYWLGFNLISYQYQPKDMCNNIVSRQRAHLQRR